MNLEIRYSSDVPVRFQARAYRDGVSVDEGQKMNASVAHAPGEGSALTWIGFYRDAEIDEIRVTGYDADWHQLGVKRLRVNLRWDAARAGSDNVPDWVVRLREAENRVAQAQRDDPDDEALAWVGFLIGFALLAALPGYVFLQYRFLLDWRGWWRAAAGLPLVPMVPIIAYTLMALSAASNLWPILLIFTVPVAFAYLLAAFLVRFFAMRLAT